MKKDSSILIPEHLRGSIKPIPLSFKLEVIIKEFNIADLEVDREYYQRPLNISKCIHMAQHWNDTVFNEPMVCRRKGTGQLYINNGQHTTTAAQYVGLEKINCLYNIHETTALQEKELFSVFNDFTTAVQKKLILGNHYDLGEAGIIEDCIEFKMGKVVEKNGFSISWRGSRANKFDCPLALINLYEIDKGKHLDNVLSFMHQCWCYREDFKTLNIKFLSTAKFLMGVSDFFKKYNSDLTPDVLKRLLKLLRSSKFGADAILMDSAKYGGLPKYFVHIHNKGLKTEQRLMEK